MSVRILLGDCVQRMGDLPDCSVDSVVCDPPYHLTSIVKRFGSATAAPAKAKQTGAFARASRGFMGQTWDGGDVAFREETWAEVLRVLKPGGHLVAFSGTRTYHRMAVAIEDAGFEVRDMIAWHYGSGFPKSHDISKGIDRAAGAEREVIGPGQWAHVKAGGSAGRHSVGLNATPGYDATAPATDAAREWEGYGTALKPATEPICLARKPLSEKSIAANVLKWGTGALNIDGCRIPLNGEQSGTALRRTYGFAENTEKAAESEARGKICDRTDPAKRAAPRETDHLGRWPANLCHDGSDEVVAGFPETTSGSLTAAQQINGGFKGAKNCYGTAERGGEGEYEANSGSAARFFYCAKATTEERGVGNNHPTVKPVALMRWLVRLVTPKGGTVLDPFMGSGSTALACDAEQFNFIGCELSPAYAEIARNRIAAAAGMFADISVEHSPATEAA